MNARIVSLFTVAALCLSLCACGGQPGTDVELGASRMTETATLPVSKAATLSTNNVGATTAPSKKPVHHTTQSVVSTRAMERLHRGNSTWQEVPIEDMKYISLWCFWTFDLQKVITSADYVFSGTILSRKEYEVSLPDKKGESNGPYSRSILEVEIHHTYHGKPPVKGNIIRVCYTHSVSEQIGSALSIDDNGEYVFVTYALNDKYAKEMKKKFPDGYAEEELYADVAFSTPFYDLFAIEDGKVISYAGYFDWDKNVMKKATYPVTSNKIEHGRNGGPYIALSKKDFDTAFANLFKNPETLPTASTWAHDDTTTTTTTTHQTRAATKAGLPTVNTDPTIVWSDPEDGES